jgi:hypothetical protein
MLTVLSLVMTLLWGSNFILAQHDSQQHEVVVLEYETGDFWLVNLITYERDHLYAFEVQLGQILDFEIDPQKVFAYVLEGRGCCGGITAGESRITRIDLNSTDTEIVFSGRNTFDIDLAPDGTSLLLTYYDPDLSSITAAARDGLSEHCLLQFPEKACSAEIDLSRYLWVSWVTSNTMLASSDDRTYLIRTDGYSVVELPYIPYWAINPVTNEIISTNEADANALNLGALGIFDVAQWGTIAKLTPPGYTLPLSFSPDGSKVILLSEQGYLIVEWVNGEAITVLSNAFDLRWINNNELIFQSFEVSGSYPGELQIYNLQSQEKYTVMVFDQRTRYRVVDIP